MYRCFKQEVSKNRNQFFEHQMNGPKKSFVSTVPNTNLLQYKLVTHNRAKIDFLQKKEIVGTSLVWPASQPCIYYLLQRLIQIIYTVEESTQVDLHYVYSYCMSSLPVQFFTNKNCYMQFTNTSSFLTQSHFFVFTPFLNTLRDCFIEIKNRT